jgi:peptide/nickel transport system substrate-binding protein
MRKKVGKARILNTIIAFLLASFILSGCTEEAAKQETPAQDTTNGSNYGGTLKLIMLDNATNIGFPAEDLGFTIYYNMPALESLGRYDTEGKIKPLLAESWQTDPDKKTITFKLKQGIKFHDDTDFNAEAVKWNIEQYQKAKRPEVKDIQSMDVVDANTLRLNLVKWDNSLLESIAWFVQMVSPTAVSKNGKEWAIKNPVGTGPFKFVSWERDVSMKFKKNENYWQKGKPYLDAIEYSFIYDRNTAANVFKSGGADVLTQMTVDTYRELEATGKFSLQRNEGTLGGIGIGLMFDSANLNSPFTKLKVRQALMHAVDTKAIINSVSRGLGKETNQWYPPGTRFYNPDVKGYPYDPDKAKQLLAEAGYPDGFKTKISTDPSRVNVATAVQSYLAKVGIEAEVVTMDIAKLLALTSGTWDGLTVYLRPLMPNATVMIDRNLGKDAIAFSKNIIHPDQVEKLLADARNARDSETTRKAILELQKVVFDEYAMFFPMYSITSGVFMQPKVQNIGMLTTNGLDWAPEDVWIKK